MAQKKKAAAPTKSAAKSAPKTVSAKSAKSKVVAPGVKLSKGAVKAKVATPASKSGAVKGKAAPAPAKPVKPAVSAGKAPTTKSAAAKSPAAKPAAAKSVAPPISLAKKTAAVGMLPVKPAAATFAQRTVPAAASGKSINQKVSAPVAAPAAHPKAIGPKDIAAKASAARQLLAVQKKPVNQRHGFKANEFVVYPAHGVGRIVGIEEQEIAGMSLELFVITFEKEKLTLRVPTGKLESVGMRKLADDGMVRKAMDILKGRARVKRTMWSRRAQEYVAKINSGDLISIAEVVRDLYRSEAQPEQSYSERQLYEDALDRMARELAAVEKLDERGAVQQIVDILSKSAKSRRAEAEAEAETEADAVGEAAA
jgi:CarD family transcriptional regulator